MNPLCFGLLAGKKDEKINVKMSLFWQFTDLTINHFIEQIISKLNDNDLGSAYN